MKSKKINPVDEEEDKKVPIKEKQSFHKTQKGKKD